ncbi:sulfite exporter TauE/SafE family protein [Candidatus Pelagibacter sp.]|nr:sulfite exporter TauE/SafE family protein [Candidatus Pelagibacter sp.]
MFLIIVGAITQSAIGIGFGIPACFLVLLEPTMVPSCIVLMGTFLAFSNAFLSLKDIITEDLAYSFSGRVVGTLISIPLITLTIGTKSFLIIFGLLLLITVFLSAKRWNVVATKKNVTIAGVCSGFMGTLTGVGGPPMAIVYQNSSSKNVVATLNMFFGIGALFSVLILIYIDLINLREVIRCLLLTPGILVGIILGRQKIVKDYVSFNLKKLILIICFVSAILVLTQAFI